MSDDVLAKTLEALRLRGTVYFEADFHPPWGMAMPSGVVAAFHVVARGECWLQRAGAEPSRLRPGDIVLLPHGMAHELVHAPQAEVRPAREVVRQILERGTETAPRPVGPDRATTSLVCGHFEYDHRALHPFFRTLPEVVQVFSGEEQAGWLAKASQLAAAESMSGQRGASVVVDRLAEALLIKTLRLFLDQSQEPRGFLAAVRDPMIGRALLSLHDNPAHDWSVDKLAREASLSRSAFTEHFRQLVGEPPMRYLSRWRMLAARRLLQGGSLTTAEVARRVGYQSEFAFAKAYKRFFDMGPGAARRSA